MEKLRIVGWTDFNSEYPSKTVNDSVLSELIQILGDEISEKGYAFSGNDHQNALTGVPVFSDGTCLRASMRSWGGIMAVIYSSVEGIDLSYMDFYMDSYKERVLPEYAPIDIEPAHVENEFPGMIIREDVELIYSAVQMGMELMTFDKVIKAYVALLQKANANEE